ncbi:MAG: anthranilate synthase component I [Chloroflexi bacterium]|nr:anthranilate synthase component I [Chloroflexota bacterium]
MYYPSLREAQQLARKGNVIPIYRELAADLETPVSVYMKLCGDNRPSFLLESVERGVQVGRYSFIGVDPAQSILADGNKVYLVRQQGESVELPLENGDPLSAVRQYLAPYRPVSLPDLPRFFGGAVGYLGYDLVRHFERLPDTASDDTGLPLFHLLLADTLVIFDHVKQRMMVVANAYLEGDVERVYEQAVGRIQQIVNRLREPAHPAKAAAGPSRDELQSNVSQERFEEMVRQAKEHITAGDVFQVVLSQRLERKTAAEPFSIYRSLRRMNPSPYMFFIQTGSEQLIGSSPEMLVRLEGEAAELRPIAGTRPRGATADEDRALEADLLHDPKERAEHVMLVDLGRNDLGRVCAYGTVHTPAVMTVERYSHVMHIVSSVKGQLRGEHDCFDLLRATFPAGTVSGAPKVRAMEIIEALEGVRRGPYAGAVGYFGYGGNMDTCITIRTIVMRDSTAYIQVGAGIVADSDPAREYEETLNKARAMAEAITMAEIGL